MSKRYMGMNVSERGCRAVYTARLKKTKGIHAFTFFCKELFRRETAVKALGTAFTLELFIFRGIRSGDHVELYHGAKIFIFQTSDQLRRAADPFVTVAILWFC